MNKVRRGSGENVGDIETKGKDCVRAKIKKSKERKSLWRT